MSRSTLEHCYEIMTNTKNGVANALMNSFADCDCDFNGANGPEYLWEEAKGFESNAAYCLSIAVKEATPAEVVRKFVSLWMEKDSYYSDYDLGVLEEGNKLFVSLAYTVDA